MKAITLEGTGGIERLKMAEIAKPVIKPNEVLIKVKAISINPVDSFVRKNEQALLAYLKLPKLEDIIVLGWDISGVVEEVGAEVNEFKQGDAVFGMVNFKGAGKAYAEYVAAPADQLALKPANISHEEAAAATLAALTAWQGLVTYADLKKGEKILIHAAAGGVGHYAVQLAKHLGAHVIGTASAKNKDFVLGLGADEFIDYTSERFEERVVDADVVFDPIPGEHVARSLQSLKQGGRIISLLTFFEGALADKVQDKRAQAYRISVVSNGDDMKALASLLQSGDLKSHVSEVFAFEDLPKAHQQVETGRTRGKIVVKGYLNKLSKD